MAQPRYNATTPQYDRLHYNHSVETAVLLKYLLEDTERNSRSVKYIVDPQGIAYERLIQHVCNIYSEQSNYPVNVGWMQHWDAPSFIEIANRIRQQIHEIRTGFDENQSNTMGKTLLPGKIKSKPLDFYKAFIQPGLSQVSKRTVVFVFDFMLVEAWEPARIKPIIELLEILACSPGHVSVKVIVTLNSPLKNTWSQQSIFVEPLPDEITEYFCKEKKNSDSTDFNEGDEIITTDLAAHFLLTPLRFLNSGAENEVLSFLGKKLDKTDEEAFWPLIQQRLVKQLTRRGVALEKKGKESVAPYLNTSNFAKANCCKVLSFQPPELILNSKSGVEALCNLEASQEFMVEALTGMIEGWQYGNKELWDFVLNRFTDTHAVAEYANQIALSRHKIVLSYLTQIILSRKELDDPRLFRSLEVLTGAYAEAVVAQHESTHEDAHEAARSYYNLYYLMDRTSTRRPKLFAGESIASSRRKLANHSVRFQQKDFAINSEQTVRHAFHLAWYLYDSGDLDAAFLTFWELATYNLELDEQSSAILTDSIGANRLAALDCVALAFSIQPKQMLSGKARELTGDILSRYGGFEEVQDLYKYLSNPTSGTSSYLGSNPPSPESAIMIHFSHYDWLPALQIADSVVFDLGLSPVMCRTERGGDFITSLSKPASVHIVLGSPDSPGEVGEFVASIDRDLASVYQARLEEDFSLPIPAKHGDKDILVLLGSGLRCIHESWVMALQDNNQFPFLQQRKMAMPFDILSTVFGSIIGKTTERAMDMVATHLATRIKKRTAENEKSSGKVEAAIVTIRQASESQGSIESAEERLATLLSRAQRRELIQLSQPVGVVSLVQDRLDEIRAAGSDVEPIDFNDVYQVLIVVADSIVEQQELRASTVNKLETFRAGFVNKLKECEQLDDDLKAGYDIIKKCAKLQARTRTIVKDFGKAVFKTTSAS